MITFEEAMKELEGLGVLKATSVFAGAAIQCVESKKAVLTLPVDVETMALLLENFVLKYDVTTYLDFPCRTGSDPKPQIGFSFDDPTVTKYYPLMETFNIYFNADNRHIFAPDIFKFFNIAVRQKKARSTTPSHAEHEKNARLFRLCTILRVDDTTRKQYTEFGQGARAAFEAITLCSDDQESESYMQEIKSKSFKEIHREINNDRGCCPLCGKRESVECVSDGSDDSKEYIFDMHCINCSATWSLVYNYSNKACIVDANGTTIIPTNQEVKE